MNIKKQLIPRDNLAGRDRRPHTSVAWFPRPSGAEEWSDKWTVTLSKEKAPQGGGALLNLNGLTETQQAHAAVFESATVPRRL